MAQLRGTLLAGELDPQMQPKQEESMASVWVVTSSVIARDY
jgi:hypothetical protein